MILDATNRLIKVTLSSAIGSEQQVTAHYIDTTSSASTPGSSTTQTNGLTPVTAVAAPSASTQRTIKALTICDTQSGGTTQSVYTAVYYDDAGTTRYLWVGYIPCGGMLMFEERDGWSVIDWRGYEQFNSSPAYTFPMPIVEQPGATNSSIATNTAFSSGSWYYRYIGRATRDHNSVNVLHRVAVMGVGFTNAYLVVARADPDPLGTMNAYIIGRTDTSGVWNSTGVKNTSVTLTGCKAGDHLWVGFGGTYTSVVAQFRAKTPSENSSGGPAYGLGQSVNQTPAVGLTINPTTASPANPAWFVCQFSA